MYTFGFEKLEVWNLSRTFVKEIYKISSTFPPSEIYGITSQMRRSAVSIISNIAEGATRKNPKDQARFTEISFSSLSEILTQIIIAYDLDYLKEEDYKSLRGQLEEISNKLNALHRFQINRSNQQLNK
jgi:four helix bundle protein